MNEIFKKSLLKKIERLEAFEERVGVKFENISVTVSSSDIIWIYLEVHPVGGNSIAESLYIECTIYDSDNHIITSKSNILSASSFFGFEVVSFAIQENDIVNRINKIRIYPKFF